MNVSLCAIERLENPYINEWIGHHLGLGFNHIYLYDNSCGDEERIDGVIKDEYKDFVTVIPCYDKEAYQKTAYNHCYKTYNSQHDWIMFIDIDEFLVLKKHNTIQEHINFCLSKNKDIQTILYNWVVYDDNDLLSRDITEPVMKSFTRASTFTQAIEWRKTTKCIVKCKIKNLVFNHVHYAKSNGSFLISSNASGDIVQKIHSQKITPSTEYAQINHYATKTITEYVAQKLHRGDADGDIVRNIDNRFFNLCTKTDKKVGYYNKIKDLKDYSFLLKHRNIVITMTSFLGRIGQVTKCLDSCLKQNVEPTKVCLNLSKVEFPTYESLPEDLRKLDKTNDLLEINFVEGNSKCFKKILPILNKLGEDDVILYTDDDMLLKQDVLKSRLNDFYYYLCEYPISGHPNTEKTDSIRKLIKNIGISELESFSSAVSLASRKMFNGYETLYNKIVEKSYHDDLFYTILFLINGYEMKRASRLFAWGGDIAYIRTNNISGKRTNKINITDDVITHYENEIKKSNCSAIILEKRNKYPKCNSNSYITNNVINAQKLIQQKIAKANDRNAKYKLIPFAGGFIKKKI